MSNQQLSIYQGAAEYLNAEYILFENAIGQTCCIFKLPCGMCEVYTDAEMQDMAQKQCMFEAIIYPKG